MTILFSGTSIADVTSHIGATAITTAGMIDESRVAEGIALTYANSFSPWARVRFQTQTEVWVSFNVKSASTNISNLSTDFFASIDNVQTGTTIMGLSTNTQNVVNLRYRLTNGDYELLTPNVSMDWSRISRVDLHCKIHATEGRFAFYIDGRLACEFVGDTTISGTSVNAFNMRRTNTTSSSSSYNIRFSSIIIATEDTRHMVVIQRLPTANGTFTDWDGSWSNVGGTGINYSSAIDYFAPGDRMSFKSKKLSTSLGASDIAAVVHSYSFERQRTLNTVKFKSFIYNDGEDPIDLDDMIIPNDAKGVIQTVATVNPVTEERFTLADLDESEFGIVVLENDEEE